MRLHGPPGRPVLARPVHGVVSGSPVYLVPRQDGELVVGATQEEAGADTTVTAGAVVQLLRDAARLVPGGVAGLAFASAAAGLRPATPDRLPVLGPTELPGLVIATGHVRSGVLLAPVTADVIARYLDSGQLAEIAAPFSLARFGRGAVT